MKQEDNNKTNNTHPRLHDSHKPKTHQLKTSNKPKLIHKDKSQAKPKPTPQGLLSLTNQLLNIKEDPKEGFGMNKIKSEKNHTLSIADKIGLLQPNVPPLPSSEHAGPGGYHVLHDPGPTQNVPGPSQHETNPFQHETHPIQHETHPTQHVPVPVQHESLAVQNETHSVQHVPPPVQHVSNPLQRDPHPVVEKGHNRNDISVSVSVSGEFGQPVTNESALSGVFLKSGPDIIRSHIPSPNSRSGQISSTNPVVQERGHGRENVAQPNGGYIPRSDIRGVNSLESKPKPPKASSNTLLDWLNGARIQVPFKNPSPHQQKAYQTDVSSSLSNSLRPGVSQRYNGRSLGNTRKEMDNLGTLLNGQSSYPMQESSKTEIQGRSPSSPGQALLKRALADHSLKKSREGGIKPRLKRQTDAWKQGQNYYTTSAYNNDRRQDSLSTYTYPSNVDQGQDRQGYPSTNTGESQKTSNNANTYPVNTKNAYFTGIDDKDDSQPSDSKSSENIALPDNVPPSSESSDSDVLGVPSPPKSNVLPGQNPGSSPASSLGAPPPPSLLSSYEDNPPRRPLSPPPSSSHPQPYPPPISPPTFDDSNPPHRPLSPPPLPSSPISSYSPSPPPFAPPSRPYHPPASPPSSSSSPPPPSYYNPAPPAPPPNSPASARPAPSYNPAPNPAPPSYSPAPTSTRPSYNSPPPSSSFPSYYPTPPSTQAANSQYNSPPNPTQPNSNSTYGSYSSSSSPTDQGASPAYNSSAYSKQSNPNSTYDSNPSSSDSSYYTSTPTASAPAHQENNPQYNSSTYPTQPNPNSTYDSYSTTSTLQPTYHGDNSQYNSSAYLTPLSPNPSDQSYLNTPNNDTSLTSPNGVNNSEYTNNNSGFQGQKIVDDFPNGVANDSWNKLLSDYNMTTQPLYTNSTDPNSGYNNIYNPNYNLTFQNIADNLATESPESTSTGNSTKTSDISLQNSLYKDLGDSQAVVGFTNTSSVQPNQNQSSNDIQELGSIENGIHSPRLTIEDMKKRIEEFSSGYNDKQAIADKKTLVKQDKGSEDILAEGKHLAPMFGGDLLLAADTVKHLAKFNDYIRPPITLDNVKVGHEAQVSPTRSLINACRTGGPSPLLSAPSYHLYLAFFQLSAMSATSHHHLHVIIYLTSSPSSLLIAPSYYIKLGLLTFPAMSTTFSPDLFTRH